MREGQDCSGECMGCASLYGWGGNDRMVSTR